MLSVAMSAQWLVASEVLAEGVPVQVESRCGRMEPDAAAPRMRMSEVKVRQVGPRDLEVVPGTVVPRVEVHLRVGVLDGRRISRTDNRHGCAGAGLRDAIPIKLTAAGAAALRSTRRLRVEVLVRDSAGRRSRSRRTIQLVRARRRPQRRCWPAGSVTLLRDAAARVYIARDGNLLGCSLQTGRRTVLGTWFSTSLMDSAAPRQGLTRLRLAGRFASYVFVDDREGGRLPQLLVHDLASGAGTYQALGRNGVAAASGYSDITDLEVTAGGSVVWIDAEYPASRPTQPLRPVVRRHDVRGDAVLDATGVAMPFSLRIAHGQAAWKSGLIDARADIDDP